MRNLDEFTTALTKRKFGDIDRENDQRTAFDRDLARITHSAAFRRLQGKTQVVSIGETDFSRTRLTHTLEVAQIGEGLLSALRIKHRNDTNISQWLPSENSVLRAACFAHDLGHPPYGHSGERALHACMIGKGGFEGNAQTIRILSKLEKYVANSGINPTRRTILATLKYPVPYSKYNEEDWKSKPPKFYYDSESSIVEWAIEKFPPNDQLRLAELDEQNKPKYLSLDASIMECADDIANAVHDFEDAITRKIIDQDNLYERFSNLSEGEKIYLLGRDFNRESFVKSLCCESSVTRKQKIGALVNRLISGVYVEQKMNLSTVS